MRYIVVINPISGAIDKSAFKKGLQTLFIAHAADYTIFETKKNNNKQQLLSLIDDYQPDRLLICGGDGTFSIFIEVLQQTHLPVGFVPMGSANGLAADMKLTAKPLQLVKKYLSTNQLAQMDSLLINDKYAVLHLADIGLNANMIKDYEQDQNRGWLTYAKFALQHLQNSQNFKVEVQHEGDKVFSQGVMVAICNGKTFGTTGIQLNKISDINDGKFEIVIIKALKFENLIRATLSKFDDEWFEMENYEIIQTDHATIHLEKPMQLQIDGEIINEFDKITVRINPNAVTYLKI